MHCVQSLEIADRAPNAERRISVMINLASLLAELSQDRLAASVSDESVRSTRSPYRLGSILKNVFTHTSAGNARAADQSARRAQEIIGGGATTNWIGHRMLSHYYAIRARPGEALLHMRLQREATDVSVNDQCGVPLMLSQAEVSGAHGDYQRAIDAAKQVLELPANIVSHEGYRFAAHCLSRCYSAGALGRFRSVEKFAQTHTQSSPLDSVFASQIGSQLKREAPNSLPPQEIECLTLSARGQTSSDIALKLGIKARTVNFHMAKMLRELNALNRHEAIAKALTANFLRI